jgi:rhodanese-related sulfurtransferase
MDLLKHTVKEIILIIGVAMVVAFTVNFFSPVGIPLMGQWDTSKGVITAKDRDVVDNIEIDDVVIAKQIYDKNKVLFVDARSSDDYEEGHIKGAKSLPVEQFKERIDTFRNQYKTDSIIVTYCSGRTCNDSHKLAQLFLDEGYTNVTVMIDGYPVWSEEGFPVE